MIRAFVGLPLPETVADRLIAAQAGLPVGRPVPRDNLHVTLAFLGEHPAPVIDDVHLALEAIECPSFALTLAGLDLFGGRQVRVLHAAVAPEPMLKHLRRKVVQAARESGVPLERERYHPHVTIARFNAGLRGEDAEKVRLFAVRGAGLRTGPFEVERFALYRSRLGREGAAYEELAAYPLAAPG